MTHSLRIATLWKNGRKTEEWIADWIESSFEVPLSLRECFELRNSDKWCLDRVCSDCLKVLTASGKILGLSTGVMNHLDTQKRFICTTYGLQNIQRGFSLPLPLPCSLLLYPSISLSQFSLCLHVSLMLRTPAYVGFWILVSGMGLKTMYFSCRNELSITIYHIVWMFESCCLICILL